MFFDRGSGRFEVRYDGLGGANGRATGATDRATGATGATGRAGGALAVLMNVTKTDSGRWMEACAEISDGRFGGGGPGGSDVWIRNADDEDDIIGAVEIADAPLGDIALKGCGYPVTTR